MVNLSKAKKQWSHATFQPLNVTLDGQQGPFKPRQLFLTLEFSFMWFPLKQSLRSEEGKGKGRNLEKGKITEYN